MYKLFKFTISWMLKTRFNCCKRNNWQHHRLFHIWREGRTSSQNENQTSQILTLLSEEDCSSLKSSLGLKSGASRHILEASERNYNHHLLYFYLWLYLLVSFWHNAVKRRMTQCQDEFRSLSGCVTENLTASRIKKILFL